MIDRMATISSGLDEHWRLIGELTGVHVAHEQIETVQEIQQQLPQATAELIPGVHRLA